MAETGHDRTPEKALARPWRAAFLAALRETGTVRDACEAAGIGRQTAYDLRAADPTLAREWDEALQDSADLLEREAVRRARVGVREPVIHQGRPCGVWVDAEGQIVAEGTPGARLGPLSVTRYSDLLLIFLLKGARPAKFRDTPPKDTTPAAGETRDPVTVYIPDNGRGDGPAPAEEAGH